MEAYGLFSFRAKWRNVRMEMPHLCSALLTMATAVTCAFAQSPPISPDRPWHGAGERGFSVEASHAGASALVVAPDKLYTLPELIDLAESHNPEIRVAWESARAQAAALGIARSELSYVPSIHTMWTRFNFNRTAVSNSMAENRNPPSPEIDRVFSPGRTRHEAIPMARLRRASAVRC
jgi:hypothetical protein